MPIAHCASRALHEGLEHFYQPYVLTASEAYCYHHCGCSVDLDRLLVGSSPAPQTCAFLTGVLYPVVRDLKIVKARSVDLASDVVHFERGSKLDLSVHR